MTDLRRLLEDAPYLQSLNDVSHWEIMVEEDADEDLHHFPVEFKSNVWCQDQLK